MDAAHRAVASTVAGLFEHRGAAEDAVRDLRTVGFADEAIGFEARFVQAQSDSAPGEALDVAGGGSAGDALRGGGIVARIVGALGIQSDAPTAADRHSTAFRQDLSEEQLRYFDSGIQNGGWLITVRAGERVADARAILERNGADLGGF
jgi:hypothetical protein